MSLPVFQPNCFFACSADVCTDEDGRAKFFWCFFGTTPFFPHFVRVKKTTPFSSSSHQKKEHQKNLSFFVFFFFGGSKKMEPFFLHEICTRSYDSTSLTPHARNATASTNKLVDELELVQPNGLH